MSDENFLFDCMGLTKTTSEELRNMFEDRIIDFLQQNQLVKALPSRSVDECLQPVRKMSQSMPGGFTKEIEVTATYESKLGGMETPKEMMKMTGLQ